MRRMGLALALGLLVAACGGSGGGATPDGGDGTGTEPGVTASPDGGGGGEDTGSGRIPSGAKLRIFNAYADPDGAPVALDVHAAPWVLEGAKPLLSVDYGTLSPVFDPTVGDEAGNMFLSGYAKGETGNGNEVFSDTETLKGGEVITYVIARGTSTMGNGRNGAIFQTLFDPTVAGTDGATPAPGKGRVVVTAAGLDTVLSGDTSWYASFGKGCTLGINDDEMGRSLVSPGTSGAAYDLDPGTYTFSLHPYDSSAATPECAGTPDFTGLEVPVESGRVSLVFLYAAKPDGLTGVAIPLSAP